MRISKNDIFLNPEKYSGLKDFDRLYVSENLSRQIHDFLVLDKERKNLERLFKMASDLGFKPMNLVLGGYDGLTVICEIKPEEIDIILWRRYDDPDPLLFSTHNADHGEIRNANIETERDWSICYGFQVFLYFLLFIDVKKKELQPKEKYVPRKYEPVKNDTKISFTVADVNWSFEVDRNVPFSVSGHYRLQRYGPVDKVPD